METAKKLVPIRKGGRKGGKPLDKAAMKKEALDKIKKHKLVFLADLYAYATFGKTAFNAKKLHEDADIIEAIEKCRIATKVGLRQKWYDTFNPTTQIALYRLICTKEERDNLSITRHEVTGENGAPLMPTKLEEIDLSKLTEEERNVLLKLARTGGTK